MKEAFSLYAYKISSVTRTQRNPCTYVDNFIAVFLTMALFILYSRKVCLIIGLLYRLEKCDELSSIPSRRTLCGILCLCVRETRFSLYNVILCSYVYILYGVTRFTFYMPFEVLLLMPFIVYASCVRRARAYD